MSAAPKELRERLVIELIEAGHSNAEINRRTKQKFGRGVNRDRIAEIRKGRPPVIAFTPEPDLPYVSFIAHGIRRAGERAEWAARANQTGAVDPFVEFLTRVVGVVVRKSNLAPRIAKIKVQGDPFLLVIADTVDRLLVFRPEDDQKMDYSKELPAAIAAMMADYDPELLIDLALRAANAARMKYIAATAYTGPAVDPTDLDEVMAWASPDTPEADSELLEVERANPPTKDPAEQAVQDANDSPIPAGVVETEILAAGVLTEQAVKDADGNTSYEMSGIFNSSVDLSNAPTLLTPNATGAAYSAGENAQFDASDRMDRSDSSNYKRAPKRVKGFAGDTATKWGKDTGGQRPSEGALTAGGERAPWSDMKAAPRTAMPDIYDDLLVMMGLERLARSADPTTPVGPTYGIGVPRRPDAIIVPPHTRRRGEGRIRVSAIKEFKERSARLRAAGTKPASDARMQATLAARMARDFARDAKEVAKQMTAAARDAAEWERLVKQAANHGIGPETLSELKRAGSPLEGIPELLPGFLKPKKTT